MKSSGRKCLQELLAQSQERIASAVFRHNKALYIISKRTTHFPLTDAPAATLAGDAKPAVQAASEPTAAPALTQSPTPPPSAAAAAAAPPPSELMPTSSSAPDVPAASKLVIPQHNAQVSALLARLRSHDLTV